MIFLTVCTTIIFLVTAKDYDLTMSWIAEPSEVDVAAVSNRWGHKRVHGHWNFAVWNVMADPDLKLVVGGMYSINGGDYLPAPADAIIKQTHFVQDDDGRLGMVYGLQYDALLWNVSMPAVEASEICVKVWGISLEWTPYQTMLGPRCSKVKTLEYSESTPELRAEVRFGNASLYYHGPSHRARLYTHMLIDVAVPGTIFDVVLTEVFVNISSRLPDSEDVVIEPAGKTTFLGIYDGSKETGSYPWQRWHYGLDVDIADFGSHEDRSVCVLLQVTDPITGSTQTVEPSPSRKVDPGSHPKAECLPFAAVWGSGVPHAERPTTVE